MCGIGGILRTDGQPIPEEWLDAIDARIAWRGPDGHGRFRDRVEIVDKQGQKRVVEVAFVHRRLSIIDHEGGKQPMVSERGRNEKEGLVAVVFNGCIYNHRELRRELEGKGHRFVTDHSDTEVLIHGWREWHQELTEHLEGMYAFAIWDRQAGLLALARDWFGEKPLFRRLVQAHDKSRTHRMIAFGSDLALLAEVPPSQPMLDEHGLQEWTSSFLQSGIVASLPVWDGGACSNGPGDLELWSSWSFRGESNPRLQETYEASSNRPLENLLIDAVERRLEADVPLGCFLSGGVDSSLVAYFARRHKPDLMTFSVRMPDARYDESAYAQVAAHAIGTKHVTLDVATNPVDDLFRLIGLLGHPFADSSILPTYWVAKAARVHVKAAISGDGGDEMFMGYERYRAAPFLAWNWWWLRLVPVDRLYSLHPKSRLHKMARLCDMAREYTRIGLEAMESIFRCRDIEELTGRELRNQSRLQSNGNAASTIRDYDIGIYLPFDLLRKVDTASMACGLEVRCPFLDRDLARAVLSMPIDQLIPGGQRKGLLRAIARKYLPREIVDRPKMGFAIPIGEWFRSDYGGMKALLLDHLNSAEPFGPISLNRKAVQRFIDEHMSGKRDHGQRLFALLTLSIWARGLTRETASGG